MKTILAARCRSVRSLAAGGTCRWIALGLVAGLSGAVAAQAVGVSAASAAHTPTHTVPSTIAGVVVVFPVSTTTTSTSPSSSSGGDAGSTDTSSSDASPNSDTSTSADVTDAVSTAEPASFDIGNQQVTATFPPGSVSQSFQIAFSTQTLANSKAPKLEFQSVSVYVGQGVAHTSKLRSHGHTVTRTVYTPNASMTSSAGTMTVDLGGIAPGSYTCKLKISYQRAVAFKGLRTTVPLTSTFTESLTVTG